MIRNLLFAIFILALVWIYIWMKARYQEYARTQQSPHPPPTADEEQYYAEILELNEPPTPSEIKRLYREQIAKYHPDKVQHLAPEFRNLADKKAKQINEAYQYFRTKYGDPD
jgi:hypothetical protein